jgi:spore coat protein CotH
MLLLLLACHPANSTGSADGDSGGGGLPGEDPGDHLPGDTSGDSGDTGDSPSKDEVYEAFFNPKAIQTIDIVLSDRAIRALNLDGEGDYQEGDVTINGVLFSDVGVRLKGSSTYEDLDCDDGYCKASWKIKLDEFVPGQKYGSLQRVTLNNMTTDYTQSKEVIVYDLLHQQSQLASLCSYARVTLNGDPWGLYANVESVDDEWAQRRFEDDSGNLWGTGVGGGDFTDTGLYRGGFVLKSGEGDLTQLAAIKATLDAYAGDFFGELDPVVNTAQFLDYWAWCATVGNYDGYPFHLNDVIMYEDPEDERRMTFAPWGTDETWDQYEYTGQTWNVVYGRLATACMADAACVKELKQRIDVATKAYAATDVMGMAQAAWDLSEADVQADPRRPIALSDVLAYRDYYAGVIDTYDAYVREKVGI